MLYEYIIIFVIHTIIIIIILSCAELSGSSSRAHINRYSYFAMHNEFYDILYKRVGKYAIHSFKTVFENNLRFIFQLQEMRAFTLK